MAGCALRTAGASSGRLRPVAFFCHYLDVARFAPVDIRVHTCRGGRIASSQRVEVAQEGRPILVALVQSESDGVDGLEHDETVAPDMPGLDNLPSIRDLVPEDDQSPYPLWNNLDAMPIDFEAECLPPDPRPARWQAWLRCRPTATFVDPWIDAARSLILVDLPSWPSAHRPHPWNKPPLTASSLDLNVDFHAPTTDED